jgi:hypothetical protein
MELLEEQLGSRDIHHHAVGSLPAIEEIENVAHGQAHFREPCFVTGPR